MGFFNCLIFFFFFQTKRPNDLLYEKTTHVCDWTLVPTGLRERKSGSREAHIKGKAAARFTCAYSHELSS